MESTISRLTPSGPSSLAAADRNGAGTDHWIPNDSAAPEGSASMALSGFPFCRLVKGWIPGSFAVAVGHRFRVVHIDVDLYDTTERFF